MRKTIIIATVALIAGGGIGYGVSTLNGNSNINAVPPSDVDAPLYWVAPMDPKFRSDGPGKSPMGMDLIPIYADAAGSGDADALTISAAVVNNIGVRTGVATVSDMPREIDTVGFIAMDDNRTSHVHVRTAGWVEKIQRKSIGEQVKKGEVIFELYSPELVSAQTEFLQALGLEQQVLVRASRDRLLALGMTNTQVDILESSKTVQQRIKIRAPQDGVIMALTIGEGMHITPDTTVFSLTDLSNIWVKVDVFEGQSDWVSAGQTAKMTLPFLPGEIWEGKVDYVYPTVDARSRTVQVRLTFDNVGGRLKPNMYGEINIAASPLQNILSVPREALIRTGKTDRVVLALGGGKFRPAEVLAGRESGDRVEIRSGLSEGEAVVTSGQFLIDSEASINSAFLRMLDAGSNEPDMDDGMAEEMDMPEAHHGTGVINSISDKGLLNISHEAITSLGWAEMTMNFKVSSAVDLSPFDAGDNIHFELTKSDDGSFIITKMTKA